jgi:hypothetical protein
MNLMLEGKQFFSYSMRLKSRINGFLSPSTVMPAKAGIRDFFAAPGSSGVMTLGKMSWWRACAGMTWIFGGRRPTSASVCLGVWPRQRQRSRLKEVFLLLFLQKKKVFLNA